VLNVSKSTLQIAFESVNSNSQALKPALFSQLKTQHIPHPAQSNKRANNKITPTADPLPAKQDEARVFVIVKLL
jgi:hypothetical protein